MKFKHALIASVALGAVIALALVVVPKVAAWAAVNATCTSNPVVTDTGTDQRITVVCRVPKPAPVTTTVTTTATATATVTATVTATPSPSSSASSTPSSAPTPTPNPTPNPTPGYSCGPLPLGDGCPSKPGPNGESGYLDTAFSSYSNGWNTYVSNQDFGVNGTQSLWANGPSDWKVVSTMSDDGGRVQTFPNAQQLYYNAGPADGPALSTFSALKVNYNETSPGGSGNHYQFSPDLFFGNYGCNGCSGDVMFWVDTNGRCNEGAWGPSLLGHFTMPDGSGWTAHRYDETANPAHVNNGNEIILVKDGAGGQGTCAQDSSGTIDIKAGLAWLSANGFMPADPTLATLQTGWEITQSNNATYRVNSLSYTATPN